MSTITPTQLSLAPLGAGDLIDRAVRLYRRHLFVLIRTAAPPVIVVAAGGIMLSISWRRIFVTPDEETLFFYIFLMCLSAGIMLVGYLFMLVVMGGATRTLVAHLLRNDPVTARATYSAVRSRFWGLLIASVIVFAWIFASFTAAVVLCIYCGRSGLGECCSNLVRHNYRRDRISGCDGTGAVGFLFYRRQSGIRAAGFACRRQKRFRSIVAQLCSRAW